MKACSLLALIQGAVSSYLTNVTSVFSTLSGVPSSVAIFTLPIFETELCGTEQLHASCWTSPPYIRDMGQLSGTLCVVISIY